MKFQKQITKLTNQNFIPPTSSFDIDILKIKKIQKQYSCKNKVEHKNFFELQVGIKTKISRSQHEPILMQPPMKKENQIATKHQNFYKQYRIKTPPPLNTPHIPFPILL